MFDVVLVGCFGYPNFGDEMLLKAWLDSIFAERQNASVVVECHVPGNAEAILGNYDHHVIYQDVLWRIAWAQDGTCQELIKRGIDAIENYSEYSSSLRFMLRRIFNAKAIHFIGGGYFRSGWDKHFAVIGEALAIKRKSKCVLTMSGQGFFPYNEEYISIFKAALNNFEHISVRDRRSFELIHEVANVEKECTIDDTFLFDKSPLSATEDNTSGRLIVCMQNDIKNNLIHNYLYDKVVRYSNLYELPIYVLEFCPRHDFEVVDLLRIIRPIYKVSFEQLFNREFCISRNDICIGTRYHFHLLAARAGARGIFGSADEYYGIKHDSILDLGSEWQNVDLYHYSLPELKFPRINNQELCEMKKKEFRSIIDIWTST